MNQLNEINGMTSMCDVEMSQASGGSWWGAAWISAGLSPASVIVGGFMLGFAIGTVINNLTADGSEVGG